MSEPAEDYDDGFPSSEHVEAAMGEIHPTMRAADRLVKGYRDGKFYLDSAELREMAGTLTAMADWLDARAEKEAPR